MRKCLAVFLAIVILATVPAFFCLPQQNTPATRPAGASTGKEYVSTKLAPGAWHIEDTVHATYRNSMYLVEGSETAALIDTGMGSGDLAAYIKTLTKLPVIVLITHGHGRSHRAGWPILDHLFPAEGCRRQVRHLTFPRHSRSWMARRLPSAAKILKLSRSPAIQPDRWLSSTPKPAVIFTGDAIGSGYVWNHIGGARPLIEYLGAVQEAGGQDR